MEGDRVGVNCVGLDEQRRHETRQTVKTSCRGEKKWERKEEEKENRNRAWGKKRGRKKKKKTMHGREKKLNF
jgi:hypothetical protein